MRFAGQAQDRPRQETVAPATEDARLLVPVPGGRDPDPQDRALGPELVRRGVVSASGLMQALARTGPRAGPLPRLLRSLDLTGDNDLAAALARRHGTGLLGADDPPPDPRLIDALGPGLCARLDCLPWRRAGAVTLVATTDPAQFALHRPVLEARLGPVVPAVIGAADLQRALETARAGPLRRQAESCVPLDESCRDWDGPRAARRVGAGLALAALLAAVWPVGAALALLAVLLVALLLSTALKLAAALAVLLRRTGTAEAAEGLRVAELPVISVMVPMFREPAIAPRLIARLGALDYPRDLLDVLLVVEADDHITRDALDTTRLPGWMRVIAVPDSPLRTKPRALNYALNFARGSLVGVYDAEDAPDRDQLRVIAAAFARGGPDLACVQGVLDYYNPDTNWMARCFTIEYATWFRLVLTGLARLRLVVPLGGTTLFFRRDILERLGGWDAHNVTEDADLGVRLARHGYRTALAPTVTQEEANCRVLPWIKQRSRWLKGYAMTYAVHMRAPGRLWRDLGAWRFLGFQVLFLGTLIQFLLAPIFWSLWLLVLGLGLAPGLAVPDWAVVAVLAILLGCEGVSLTINLLALRARRHRHLRLWVPTLTLYFPLATLAAYKAAWELLVRPFYWDKTVHGVDDAMHRPVTALT